MNIEDIPNDVLKVWALTYLKQPVGGEMHQWALEVRKTYPQFFPWENTYDSITNEVHSAYREESQLLYESFYPSRPKVEMKEGEGLWAYMQRVYPETTIYKPKTIKECIDELKEKEKKKIEYEVSKIKLWNKYYKKYKLDYRG